MGGPRRFGGGGRHVPESLVRAGRLDPHRRLRYVSITNINRQIWPPRRWNEQTCVAEERIMPSTRGTVEVLPSSITTRSPRSSAERSTWSSTPSTRSTRSAPLRRRTARHPVSRWGGAEARPLPGAQSRFDGELGPLARAVRTKLRRRAWPRHRGSSAPKRCTIPTRPQTRSTPTSMSRSATRRRHARRLPTVCGSARCSPTRTDHALGSETFAGREPTTRYGRVKVSG